MRLINEYIEYLITTLKHNIKGYFPTIAFILNRIILFCVAFVSLFIYFSFIFKVDFLNLKHLLDLFLGYIMLRVPFTIHFSNYDITKVIFCLAIPIIFIPIIHQLLEGAVIDRVLSLVYHVNFSIDIKNLFCLFLGYIASSLVVAYAIRELCVFKFPDYQSINSIAFTSLAICYTSRLISTRQGSDKGKELHSFLFSAAAIVFFITVFVGINERYIEKISELTSLKEVIYSYIIYFRNSLFSNLQEVYEYITTIWNVILKGSLITASLGEIILYLFFNKVTILFGKQGRISIPYSLYRLISTNKIKTKMKGMISSQYVKSIKITSRSLVTFELIYNLVVKLANQNNPPLVTINAPEWSNEEFECYLNSDYKKKLLNIVNNRHMSKRIYKYFNNLKTLREMENKGLVNWVKKDPKDFKVIIVNNEKALLTVNSGDFRKCKVGLYSEEPSTVGFFISVFNEILEQGKDDVNLKR